jgi:hypothetical protein
MATRGTELKLRRTLSHYASSLASIVVALVGVSLLFWDKSVTLDRGLSTIGLGLISAALSALLISGINTRVQERILLEKIGDEFSTLATRITDNAAELNNYVPIGQYAATEDFNPNFNRAITNALETSSLYYFRGTTAKYVPARLQRAAQVARVPNQVKVVMLDVKAVKAVRRKAGDLKKRHSTGEMSTEVLMDQIIDETLMSLVALFDCRHLCSIEIGLNPASGLTRVELFDSSVFISWYANPAVARLYFPETMKFKAESYMHEYQRLELLRRVEICDHKVTFDSNQEEDDILDILTNIAARRVTRDEVEAWRVSYDQMIESFLDQLRRI